MGLLVLGAIAVIALVAASKPKRIEPRGETPPPSAPVTPSSPPKSDKADPAELAGLAGSIPMVGVWAAAGTAAAWAGGELSQNITGNQGKTSVEIANDLVHGREVDFSKGVDVVGIASETTAALGLSYSGGMALGKGINEALGGRDDGISEIIAENLTGSVALFAFLDPIAASGWALTSGLIYAVWSTFSDVARLAYGQSGAREDYRKAWEDRYSKTISLLQSTGKPPNAASWAEQDELDRWAIPIVDGFMRETNRINQRVWMTNARGLTNKSDYDHADYGWIRGYFVAARPGLASGDGTLTGEPGARCWEDSYRVVAARHPFGALKTVRFERLVTYRWKLVVKPGVPMVDETTPALPGWVTPEMLEQTEEQARSYALRVVDPTTNYEDAPKVLLNTQSQPIGAWYTSGETEQINVSDWFDTVYLPVTNIETGVQDDLSVMLMEVGAHAANIAGWVSWMQREHGAFVNDMKHAQEGVKQGRFTGAPESDGSGNVIGLRISSKDEMGLPVTALVDATGKVIA